MTDDPAATANSKGVVLGTVSSLPLRGESSGPGSWARAGEWALLFLGCALVFAYRWHLDDAFIYFRTVDNWVDFGHGPVFNEGEWVEGYTSPLWLLLLAGLRSTTTWSYWTITQLVGIACWSATWLLLVRARRAADKGAQLTSPNFALALVAGHYAVASYFTSGTESPLVLVAASAFVLFTYQRESLTARVLVGLSPLVRPELLLALAISIGVDRVRSGRWSRTVIAIAASTGSAWLLFRVWAYADLFPNTFHLKDEAHLEWGIAYLRDAFGPYGGYVVAFCVAWLAALGPRHLAAPRWSLFALFALLAAYVVRVGGDGRHFRYLLFPYVVLTGATLGFAPRWLGTPRASSAATLVAGAIIACLWPHQLDRHPLLDGVEEKRIGVVRDAQFHRAIPELRADAPAPDSALDADVVGVTGWCHEAWASPRARWIHKDGLTEPIIAHSDAAPFRPAHFESTLVIAEHIARIRATYGGRGAFQRAVEAKDAAPWVAANLDALEALDARTYNEHRFVENLALALGRVPTVHLEAPATTDSIAPR